MRVMSVPQHARSGPNASNIWRRYSWMFSTGTAGSSSSAHPTS